MKLFERVYFSLKGMKTKSILLFLSVLLLFTFLSASFSVFQANKSLEVNLKKALNPSVIIHWNKEVSTYEEIDNIINSFRKEERLKYIENRYAFSDYLKNISAIHFEFKDEDLNPINDGGQFKNNTSVCYGNNCIQVDYIGWKDIHAFDSYILSDLKYDELSLIYGRSFNEDEIENGKYVLLDTIGYDTADHLIQRVIDAKKYYITANKIIVNDTNENYYIVDLGYKQEFNMLGIIQRTSNNLGETIYHMSAPYGSLFVPFETMKKMNDELILKLHDLDNKYDYLSFNEIYKTNRLYDIKDTYLELYNVDDLDIFINEIEENYGKYIHGVYSYKGSFNDVKSILKNLNLISMIVLVMCIIASIILLSLIIQVLVHERRYEIGVYLSMGEKRINIIKQILLEVLSVGLLGITLSLFVGNMVASSLSEDLLQRQISHNMQVSDPFDIESTYEIDEEEIISAYQVEINGEYVLSVYTGGVIVLLISCIIPMKSIMKMKVKRMLL